MARDPHGRRPRLHVAFILLTLPIWFIPALLYVGWKEAGVHTVKELPQAARYALLGK